MSQHDPDADQRSISWRRTFIAQAADGAAVAAPSPTPPAIASNAGYTLFGPQGAAFAELLADTSCPTDALIPDDTDCGVAGYMDRQLAADFGRGERMYSHGPRIPGKPQQGYQLPIKAAIAAARSAAKVLSTSHS